MKASHATYPPERRVTFHRRSARTSTERQVSHEAGVIKVVGALEREEMTHGSGSQSTVDDENLTQFL